MMSDKFLKRGRCKHCGMAIAWSTMTNRWTHTVTNTDRCGMLGRNTAEPR